jgi:hypothetical protein
VPDAPPTPTRDLRGIAVLLATLGAGLWIATRAGLGDDAAGAARMGTRTGGPGAGVAALTVRTLDGRTLPLTAIDEPAVVMVVSTSCGVCKEALADFGRMGRPMPRLWLVTLEGAARGVAMTRAAGVQGVVHAGPPTPAAEALFTFQVQGTPTFVALDAGGRVQDVLPGYPGREAIAPWVSVMTGEREALR